MKRRSSAITIGVLAIALVFSSCGGGGGSGSGGSGTATWPTITTASLPDAITATNYSIKIQATGDAPFRFEIVPSSGFGLTIDGSTGDLTGAVTSAGTMEFGIKLTDRNSRSVTKTLQLKVNNRLQLAANPNPPQATANAPFAWDLPLVSPSGPGYSSLSASVIQGALPAGVAFNGKRLEGTPTQTGDYSFTVRLTMNSDPPQTAENPYSMTVDSKFLIVSSQLDMCVKNSPCSTFLKAVNGTAPYSWGLNNALAPGLTLEKATGKISGTPTQSANYSYTVAVSDSSSPQQTLIKTVSHTINDVLSITSPSDMRVGLYAFQQLAAFGGLPPYTISWTGTIPGITASKYSSGVKLEGWPQFYGSFPVTMEVTDSQPVPQTAHLEKTLLVYPSSMVVKVPNVPKIRVGETLSVQPTVTGGVGPYAWSVSNFLPPEFSFDSSNGKLTGTAAQKGYFATYLKVIDSFVVPESSFGLVPIIVGPRTSDYRNDSPSKATWINGFGISETISPFWDETTQLEGDNDYFRITAARGSHTRVTVNVQNSDLGNPMDPVLELVDANGSRLNWCYSGNSECVNDDSSPGAVDSTLDLYVPSGGSGDAEVFIHVLDYRGDARPEMVYSLSIYHL
jgi:hypothetical protein